MSKQRLSAWSGAATGRIPTRATNPTTPCCSTSWGSGRPTRRHVTGSWCRTPKRSTDSPKRRDGAHDLGAQESEESPMADTDGLTIKFRCPPELEGVLPRPIAAVRGLPEWFKAMPQTAFSTLLQEEQMTIKKCPPVIDAMTAGFLMPLVADLRVEDGAFAWDRDVPAGSLTAFMRAPIDFHDNNQVVGTPFFSEDQFLIKFTNFWTF